MRHGLHAEDVVAEKRGLSARERLAVYTGGYVLRLLECMREDFPVLRGFVGDSVFDAFAKAYVITLPPTSHSLYDLGADFPRFLEETKPKNWQLDSGISVMLDLPPELARIERARAEVLRARGTEDDPPAAELLSPFSVFAVSNATGDAVPEAVGDEVPSSGFFEKFGQGRTRPSRPHRAPRSSR